MFFALFDVNLAAGLTNKYLTGGASSSRRGLGKTDYDELLSKARCHKEKANSQLKKMQKLSRQGRESKEAGILHLHREVWTLEWQRLARERGVVETEIEKWRSAVLLGYKARGEGGRGRKEGGEREEEKEVREEEEGGGMERLRECQWVEEMMEYDVQLAGERRIFERDTLQPVQELVEKLKCWVRVRENPEAEQTRLPLSGEVKKEVCGVRRELGRVWAQLEEECTSLCSYLATTRSVWGGEGDRGEECREEGMKEMEVAEGSDEEETRIERQKDLWSVEGQSEDGAGDRGVPAALLCCSSQQLRTSLAQEVFALDAHYQDVLKQLQDKHREALR